VKSHHYWKAVDSFKRQLSEAIPHAELKALHERSGPRHLAYAARQFAIILACSWALWRLESPWLWLPFAVLQGFTFFNMTTLLHELERTKKRYGLQTMCIGFGQGIATIIERV